MARRAHSPEVVGSNPVLATKNFVARRLNGFRVFVADWPELLHLRSRRSGVNELRLPASSLFLKTEKFLILRNSGSCPKEDADETHQ